MDEREQISVGKDLTEHFEGFFAPAHPGQPVVNKGYTQHLILPRRCYTIGAWPTTKGSRDRSPIDGKIQAIVVTVER